MKPATVNLPTIWRGCDWGPLVLKWKDASGNPIDLTDWIPRAESLNIDFQPVVTDPAGGVVQMGLSRVDTGVFRLGVEHWDWIWEHVSDPYRFPPFLAGIVEIKEPQTAHSSVVIVPPSSNDNIADAIEIFGESGSLVGTNVGATRESGEPVGENSVWYKWTPNRDKTAIMQIGMNWLNIAIFVPNFTPPTPGESPVPVPPGWDYRQIAHSSGDPSAVSWPAVTGVTYWIRLYTNTRTSAFTLVWSMTDPGIPAI
jgi:hypothetical protein